MWIKTQDGELINVDYVKRFYIHGSWLVAVFTDGGVVKIAEYSEENEIKNVLEKFAEKLRRTGKRFFKFEKEK